MKPIRRLSEQFDSSLRRHSPMGNKELASSSSECIPNPLTFLARSLEKLAVADPRSLFNHLYSFTESWERLAVVHLYLGFQAYFQPLYPEALYIEIKCSFALN
jgi:hypothetical protein